MHGEIELPLGSDEHRFNVARHKQLFELQDKCGMTATGVDGESILIPSGPMEIFNRLRAGTWRAADVVQPIRLGLIGADMPPADVKKLMLDHVHDQPLAPLAPLAARIVFAAIFGVAGDDLGKQTAERDTSKVEGGSTSPDPQPMEQEPR